MRIDEHRELLQSAIKELARTQVDDSLLTTLDMIGLIKLRLAEQGLRSDSSSFSDYSPIYSKARQKKGLQVAHKDFNVTGQLYASIHPEVKAVSFGGVAIDIVPRGNDNKMKVIGQIKRDGNLLMPSPAEIQEAIRAQSRRRIDRANQLLSR